MKHRLLIVACGAALALGACKKNNDAAESANDVSMTADNGSAMGNDAMAASPTSAQGFVNATAASDRFEIESSRLAETAGSSSAVKKFATQMIKAHTDSTAKLKSTLAGMTPPVTPDDTLNAEQQAALANLQGLKGAEFDSAYVAAQTDAHQKTLDTLKAYASDGDTPALKTFASGLVPTVTAHLNMAKGLK